jgi:hypothetical protein
MSKSDFDKFVARQKAKAAASKGADAKARRKEWLAHIDTLYERVEAYLREYIVRGDVEVAYQQDEINEEFLGAYKTKRMTLKIGPQVVQLIPIGAFIIGAKGRVDLAGSLGRCERLLLVGRESLTQAANIALRGEVHVYSGLAEEAPEVQLAWKFATPPPSSTLIDLTRDTLMEAIVGVAGG